jgi:hypothetical protein
MDILQALTRAKKLVDSSEDSAWSHLTTAQISQRIQYAIDTIEDGGKADVQELLLLFAPTGAIQDTSIDIGWGYELAVRRPDGNLVPLEGFVADGLRWWQAMYVGDKRTEGHGIFPAGKECPSAQQSAATDPAR